MSKQNDKKSINFGMLVIVLVIVFAGMKNCNKNKKEHNGYRSNDPEMNRLGRD